MIRLHAPCLRAPCGEGGAPAPGDAVGVPVTGADVHWGALGFTAAFYLLIFIVGWRAGRKGRGGADELMLAGRRMPLWLGVFTMSATWVGGGYINGSAEAAYASGLVWVQAPWGYAASLAVGGLVFAGPMRSRGYRTLLDPIAHRFGDRLGAALYLPALAGEVFWSGAILTALGATFATVVGLDLSTSIVVSATIAIAYTLVGGLWAVAATDVAQLLLLLTGLAIALPQIAAPAGGLVAGWQAYVAETGGNWLPPLTGAAGAEWGAQRWAWWDGALLLVFGGIPWQVYFQRVLAARDAATARRLSFLAAFACLAAAVPAVLIGALARVTDWGALGLAPPPEAAVVLPWALRYLTDPWVAAIGLGAVAAAVMSSVDSSILSAASMGAWNVYRPLVRPELEDGQLVRVVRRCVVLAGVAALLVALRVQSVYALWFLCSDLVYCILFPQLVAALFDRRANRTGAAAGLLVSVLLRAGGGEPALGLPRWLPYPMVDPVSGAVWFPFRTFAMLAGLATLMVVSRFTARRDPPRPLDDVAAPGRG